MPTTVCAPYTRTTPTVVIIEKINSYIQKGSEAAKSAYATLAPFLRDTPEFSFNKYQLLQMTMVCGDTLINEFKHLAGPIKNDNVDAAIMLEGDKYYGWSSLMRAIDGNHIQLVTELVSTHRVTTINHPLECVDSEFNGFTPLLLAYHRGYDEIAKFLFTNGASLTLKLNQKGHRWHNLSPIELFIRDLRTDLMFSNNPNMGASLPQVAPLRTLTNAPMKAVPGTNTISLLPSTTGETPRRSCPGWSRRRVKLRPQQRQQQAAQLAKRIRPGQQEISDQLYPL